MKPPSAWRILIFPIDLLDLTWRYLRLTGWLVADAVLRAVGGEPRPTVPCVRRVARLSLGGIEGSCLPARRYAFPALARLLCGALGLDEEKGIVQCRCHFGSRPALSPLRYLVLTMLLFLFWGSVSGAIVLGVRKFLGQDVRRNVPRATPRKAVTSNNVAASRYLSQARTLHSKGDLKSARLEYRNAIAIDPESIEAQLGLGGVDFSLGEFQEAERAFAAAVAMNPSAVTGHVGLAHIALARGDLATAESHCKKARALNAGDASLSLLLARVALLAGAGPKAREEADAARALGADATETSLLLGKAHWLMGNTNQAVRAFQEALRARPNDLDATLSLAGLLRAEGSFAESREALAVLLSDTNAWPAVTVELAETAVAEGRLGEAAALLADLTSKHPDARPARFRLAQLQVMMGDVNAAYKTGHSLILDAPDDSIGHLVLVEVFLNRGLAALAVEHARKAVALKGAQMLAHRLLSRALVTNGDYDAAIEELSIMRKTMPDDMETLILLAFSLDRSGAGVKAVSVLRDAAAAHPASPSPLLHLGHLFAHRGEHRAALDSYRKALELHPNHVLALNNAAHLLLDEFSNAREAKEEALRLAERAWKLAPANPVVADTLGWAYFQMKRMQDAESLLGYAVARLPRDPTVHYHFAELLAAKGSAEQAAVCLRAALALSPSFDEVERARALLRQLEKPPKDG